MFATISVWTGSPKMACEIFPSPMSTRGYGVKVMSSIPYKPLSGMRWLGVNPSSFRITVHLPRAARFFEQSIQCERQLCLREIHLLEHRERNRLVQRTRS